MYKYITILGAAGQIAQKLTATLLTYTDMHLTLYGRQLSTRLHPEILEHERVTVIEGSFQNPAKLEQAVTNAEIVFVGAMEAGSDMASIVKALSRKNVRRVIGHCDAMNRVVSQALAIARRPINTLILGPTGTGKEVIAKTIHYHSPRREAPFVAVNCTAIPDSLFESEMFGIEKGVATGVNARRGLVEEASGGTLFLDELADMSLANQAKLLRVLEEREVLRVGSAKPVPVDIKIIAATNVNLEEAVKDGRFREDLYYRINVAELRLPPLRERGDDILLLARHLLEQHARVMGRPRLSLAPATRQCLLAYDWPGNVRELNNEMERAAALALEDVIRPSDLSARVLAALAGSGGIGVASDIQPDIPAPPLLRQADVLPEDMMNLDEAERLLIQRALEVSGGNKSRAASMACARSCCVSASVPIGIKAGSREVRHEHDAPDSVGPAGRRFGRSFRGAGTVSDLEDGRRDHDSHGGKKFFLVDAGGGRKPERRLHEPTGEQGARRAGTQEPVGRNGGAGRRHPCRPERKPAGRRAEGAADQNRVARSGFRRDTA